MITTLNELQYIAAALSLSKEITFDFETTDLHHKIMKVDGIALCADNLEPVFIWSSRPEPEYSRYELHEFMQEVFSLDALYIGHNLQFDIKVLKYFYQVQPERIFDTMIASWYLDENRQKSLKFLGDSLLGIPMKSYSAHVKEEKALLKEQAFTDAAKALEAKNLGNKITKKAIKELAEELIEGAEVPIAWLEEYSKLDAEATYKLYKLFTPLLEEEPRLQELFYSFEMPFISVLVDMTLAGIDVNIDLLKGMEDFLSEEKVKLENLIYKELGEFNINSPAQLSEKIFGISVTRKGGKVILEDVREPNKQYAKPVKFTPTNTPSTDDASLEPLQTKAAELVREYRKINKLLETYAIGYQKFVIDGKLYPSFNHVGAVTGRLSSDSPNMQNLPSEKTGDFFIRDAFIAPPGYKLVIADESQLELRILAHFSNDPVLMEAFLSGKDIHAKTASDTLVIPIEDITSTQRKFFKVINFGIMYGMGPQKLALTLGISEKEAKELLRKYFKTYAGIPAFIKVTENQMINKGFIKTILGRKRRIIEVWSKNKKEVFRALRQTVNSKIQGSAADVLKAAMIKIHKEFIEEGLDAHILLQIHDELVCRVREDHVEKACAIIQKHMEHPFGAELKVPLITEPKVCDNWGAGKD